MQRPAILIALGANLPSPRGDPAATIIEAAWKIGTGPIRIRRMSSLYQSPAWPDPHDPPFVNAVAELETGLAPAELLRVLHETETAFGRTRSARNAPRTLDLDLIDYRGRVQAGTLVLPHPRMESRAFVLIPLAEVAPLWRHPVSGKTVEELVAGVPAAERESVRRVGT